MAGTAGVCSNRTFMELKYNTPAAQRERYEGSNRTFMELKCRFADYSFKNMFVLIAPLWN